MLGIPSLLKFTLFPAVIDEGVKVAETAGGPAAGPVIKVNSERPFRTRYKKAHILLHAMTDVQESRNICHP